VNITELQKKFRTQKKAMEHLEWVRWHGEPVCPFCDSTKVYKRKQSFYFHCNDCNRDFTVLKGTIFERSHLPLTKWFQLIALMLNARKGLSAKQISRDVGLTYKTAWYSAMRIRCAMIEEPELLEGIVEMDEAYVGGKPRKRGGSPSSNTAAYSNVSFEKPKRGRGTKKLKVLGVVQRKGKAATRLVAEIDRKSLLAMLKRNIKLGKDTKVMTDELVLYKAFNKLVNHQSVNHSKKEYVKGEVHTNTIEGFWSIVKNGIRGQYHVLSKKYLPFYLAEFTYKYNRQHIKDFAFAETIERGLNKEKCAVNYKPIGRVSSICYPPKKKKVKEVTAPTPTTRKRKKSKRKHITKRKGLYNG
jgi:transposase-like protein